MADSTTSPPKPIRKTRWFICLFIWWIIAMFFYLFLAGREARLSQSVIASGVAVTQTSAENAGLPLLERDVQALTRLAQSVAANATVVNVSIIDHRNKIITFTDMDWLFPKPSTSLQRSNGVSYWPQTLRDGTPVICFSADINYAGTKIGEVLMARTAETEGLWRSVFLLCAGLSLLIIVFALLVADFHGMKPLKAAVGRQVRKWIGADDGLPDGREIVCPLCGHQKPLTRGFLLDVNLGRYPVLRLNGDDDHTDRLLRATGIHLREIGRRGDLGWLKRKIVHRCADIIKQLAGE